MLERHDWEVSSSGATAQPETVGLAGRIVPCPCSGYAPALRLVGRHGRRLVVDCGDRTLVMGEDPTSTGVPGS